MAAFKEDNGSILESERDGTTAELSGGPSGPGDYVLHVDGNTTLSILAENLIVTKPRVKRHRTCSLLPAGDPPLPSSTIPLYNVLWAELGPTTLTIDYARALSPTRVRPAALTFAVEPDAADAASAFAAHLLRLAYGRALPRQRFKVLVNPRAGPGSADRLWGHEARPILEAARASLCVTTTRFHGEAAEIARGLDADAYDAILACSGDGLPHEIFNGLGTRPDASRALRALAVAHIPCGSGNAMSCNLSGTHRASLAALAVVKGVRTPLDLASVTQGRDGARYLSFLSTSLGIVAESDLATEHMRWMGTSRFTVGFLTRIFKRKVYPCELAVKVEVGDKVGVREHYRRARAGLDDDAVATEGKAEGAAVGAEPSGESGVVRGDGGLPALKYGTVNDKVPEGWEVTSHDKLGNFYCGNMAYMAPDANFFPTALPSDGLLDLVTIDGDISPLSAVSLLLSVESGTFFDSPLVSYRKVSALRVTPRGWDADGGAAGYLSVDGERVPFEPFQVEVHRGLGTVISRAGGYYEAPGPCGWEAGG